MQVVTFPPNCTFFGFLSSLQSLLKYSTISLDISSTLTEPCCALKYYPEIEICVKEQKGEQEAKRKEAQRLEDENFGTHIIGRVRTYLWNLFEYPETSREAQVSILVYLNLYSRSHRP